MEEEEVNKEELMNRLKDIRSEVQDIFFAEVQDLKENIQSVEYSVMQLMDDIQDEGLKP